MRDDDRIIRGGRGLKAIGFIFCGAFVASQDWAFLWWFGGFLMWGELAIRGAEDRIAAKVRAETERLRDYGR